MSDLDEGRIRKIEAQAGSGRFIELFGPWPRPIPVRQGTVLQIGRQPTNEIVLQGGTVSRTHAAIVWDAKQERPTLEDLGSANGTAVDGLKVEAGKPVVLKDGAVIDLGGHRLGVGRPAPAASAPQTSEPTDTTKVRRRDLTTSDALGARTTDRLPRQDLDKKKSGTTEIGYVSFTMRRDAGRTSRPPGGADTP